MTQFPFLNGHLLSYSVPQLSVPGANARVFLGSVNGFSGIWFVNAAPTTSNFGFLFDHTSNSTLINAPSGGGVFFQVGNATKVQIDESPANNDTALRVLADRAGVETLSIVRVGAVGGAAPAGRILYVDN